MTTNYVELHCHSAFSLLDGVSSPAALVERAAYLGMDALALTDHDSVDGLDEARSRAAGTDLEIVSGVELSADLRAMTSAPREGELLPEHLVAQQVVNGKEH